VASLRSPGTISSSRCQITRDRLLEEQIESETCFLYGRAERSQI
jgi:hypothetical protein